jgi:hypothetical protein
MAVLWTEQQTARRRKERYRFLLCIDGLLILDFVVHEYGRNDLVQPVFDILDLGFGTIHCAKLKRLNCVKKLRIPTRSDAVRRLIKMALVLGRDEGEISAEHVAAVRMMSKLGALAKEQEKEERSIRLVRSDAKPSKV